MRKAYNALGWVVAGLVMLQAASMAWGVGGENHFIDSGGVVDKALVEAAEAGGEPPFPEVLGFPIHGLNGGLLIPVLALVLVGVSFRARLPRARRNAAFLFALVFVQVMLGYSIVDLPLLGFFHGLNALLVFAAALGIARHKHGAGGPDGTGAATAPAATAPGATGPAALGDTALTSAEH